VRATIQGLGWYVRRAPNVSAVGAFFHDVVGLPHVRPDAFWEAFRDIAPQIFVLRGGDGLVLEVMLGGQPAPQYRAPEDCGRIPVFRSRNLDSLVGRLRAAGVSIVADRHERLGRTAYALDPLGNLTGFRQPDPASPLAAEHRSAIEWAERGPGEMPPDVQDLGYITLRVMDVRRQVAFYRDTVGLDVVLDHASAGAVLGLGENALLEILPGGAPQQAPRLDRSEVNEMWMLRVRDLPEIVHDLRKAGARVVNSPFIVTGGALAYLLDPEGHLIGIQDHPLDPALAEEVEADRRWRAR
jgi:predicted enzyme related to lactoylglutathione lyase